MLYSHKNKNKKGVSIYLALIVMVIFLGMGFGLANILLSLKKTIRGMGDSVNTLAAADTGVEYMLKLERDCWDSVAPCSSPCKSDCRGRINGNQVGPFSLDNGATYQAQIIRTCGLNTVFSTSTYKDTNRRIKFTVDKFKTGTTTNSVSGKHCDNYCLQNFSDDCAAISVGTDSVATNAKYYLPGSCAAGLGLTSTQMTAGGGTCESINRAWTNCYCTSTIPY